MSNAVMISNRTLVNRTPGAGFGAAFRPLALAAMLAAAAVPALTYAGQGYRGPGPGHDGGRNDGPRRDLVKTGVPFRLRRLAG